MNTAYLDMIQGKNPGVTPVWYMRQAGRSQAEYRKIKEKYSLFEITKEPELCARVTELPVKEYGVDAAILYKDIMSPMVAMNVNVELKAGVGHARRATHWFLRCAVYDCILPYRRGTNEELQ